MNHDGSKTPESPRWLHVLAVLTVLFTLPLVFLGASVTSHDVGMVDPRGFRWPWEIVRGLFENNGLGWMLEYGHRTFGFLVGFCGIGLAIGCWRTDRRLGLTWLGIIALALISAQGVLGAVRVNYNAVNGRTFAMAHGIFAQVVVAFLVTLAMMTSRHWTAGRVHAISPALKRWTLIAVGVVFVQLILGAMIRHQQDSIIGPRGHLLGAFVVVGVVLWLMKVIRESDARAHFSMHRVWLKGLLVLQIVLGMESWLAKFFVDGALNQQQLVPLPMHGEWIRTLHYLVGTMIFATTVAMALTACRRAASRAEELLSSAPPISTHFAVNAMPSEKMAELEGVR